MCEQQTAYGRRDGEKRTVDIDQCESFYNRQKKIGFHHHS